MAIILDAEMFSKPEYIQNANEHKEIFYALAQTPVHINHNDTSRKL